MTKFDSSRHPRGRDGRFIDVLGRMRRMGAEWNATRGTWTVPKDQKPALQQLLFDLGLDVKDVKPTSSHTKAKTTTLPGPDDLIDVQGRMGEMGGVWNESKGTWTVPREQLPQLNALLAEMGLTEDPDVKVARTGGGTKRYVTGLPGPSGAAKPKPVSKPKPKPVKPKPKPKPGPVKLAKATPRTGAGEAQRYEGEWNGREIAVVQTVSTRGQSGAARRVKSWSFKVDGDTVGRGFPDKRTAQEALDAHLNTLDPTPKPKPKPKPVDPRAASLTAIRERAEAMRAEPLTPVIPEVGDRVMLGGLPVEIKKLNLSSFQYRIHPQTGKSFMVGSEAPDGAWGMTPVLQGADGKDYTAYGSTSGIPGAEVETWEVDHARTQPRNYTFTVDYVDAPVGEGGFTQRLIDFEGLPRRSWQDEAQVREVGKAIREHLARFRRPESEAIARARAAADAAEAEYKRQRMYVSMKERSQLVERMQAARAEVERLGGGDPNKAEADELRAILQDIRPGFGTGKFRGKARPTEWDDQIATAGTVFPKEWVDAARKSGRHKYIAQGRGYYSSWSGTVNLGNGADQHTVTHEFGHMLQYRARGASSDDQDRRIDAAAVDFHRRRTREAGSKVRPIREVPGFGYYDASEVTNDDNYLHPYMGKEYGGDPLEIWTMGVENVWHGERYGAKNLKRDDPEYWDLIVGILAGVP